MLKWSRPVGRESESECMDGCTASTQAGRRAATGKTARGSIDTLGDVCRFEVISTNKLSNKCMKWILQWRT